MFKVHWIFHQDSYRRVEVKLSGCRAFAQGWEHLGLAGKHPILRQNRREQVINKSHRYRIDYMFTADVSEHAGPNEYSDWCRHSMKAILRISVLEISTYKLKKFLEGEISEVRNRVTPWYDWS
ncbi:hypothetical protein [Photobacterium gaetbulicola]|uniref:hypothetical protein n=1 Tax=Photobacterium gaetbulicola TaxID=1295392 RepID=UPI0012E02720|nr:hypothetical protein [Photobacterium gaetbulicola]